MKSVPRILITAALLLIVAATVGLAVRDEVRQRGAPPAQATPAKAVPAAQATEGVVFILIGVYLCLRDVLFARWAP